MKLFWIAERYCQVGPPWTYLGLKGFSKEGNVLINDALNTFYLRLNGVGHMVKDHSSNRHYMGYSFRLAASDF